MTAKVSGAPLRSQSSSGRQVRRIAAIASRNSNGKPAGGPLASIARAMAMAES